MNLLSADAEYEPDPLLAVLKQLIGDPWRRMSPAEVAALTDYQIAECYCKDHSAKGKRRDGRAGVEDYQPPPPTPDDSDAEAFVDGEPADGEPMLRALVAMGLVRPEEAERTIAARKMAWRAEQEAKNRGK